MSVGATVTRIGFATMKGTRHLARDEVRLDRDGPVGDRLFCLVDGDRGRVLRTVQHPTLVGVRVDHRAGTLRCRFPDGSEVAGSVPDTGTDVVADYWGRDAELSAVDGPWAEAFTDYLGRPVALARVRRRGAVVYGGSVTLLTEATLTALAAQVEALAGGAAESVDRFAARFRSTLVLGGGHGPGDEQGFVGRRLRVGAAELMVEGPVPRCAVIDLDPVTGERNRPVLRAAGARPGHEPAVGVDARVIRPGLVRLGDPAVLLD